MSASAVTFLFIDDNEDICDIMELEVEAKGHHILVANSVDKAISIYTDKKPDIIVLDAHLDGEDGEEFLHKLKEQNLLADLPPTFFMTGDLDFDEEKVQSLGAHGVFFKPVNFEDVIVSCLKYLNNVAA